MTQEQHTEQANPRKRGGGILLTLLIFLLLIAGWVFLEYKGLAPVSILPKEIKALWGDKGGGDVPAQPPAQPAAQRPAPVPAAPAPRPEDRSIPSIPLPSPIPGEAEGRTSSTPVEVPGPTEPETPAVSGAQHNASQPAANATLAPQTGAVPTATAEALPYSDLPEPGTGLPEREGSGPVTHYSRATPEEGGSGAARGRTQAESDTPRPLTRTRMKLGKEDSVVRLAFVDSVARHMAESYWPQGTHLQARSRGISTFSLKWANAYYGLNMEGFSPSLHADQKGRSRVLGYTLMPSMINALSRIYVPAFLTLLEEHGRAQVRGTPERPLTERELAEMYGIYAVQASSLASVLRGYVKNDNIDRLAVAYIDAEEKAHEAGRVYFSGLDVSGRNTAAGNNYQVAVVRREQAKNSLASAIRRNADTRGLDEDTLVFAACWLHRRTPEMKSAIPGLADVLADVAGQLETMRLKTLNPEPAR